MNTKKVITKQRLVEIFDFDMNSGHFTWKVSQGVSRIGTRAGSNRVSPSGRPYRQIGIDRNSHFEHRLVWLWVYGYWPSGSIDHIDGDASNNHPSNLRIATGSQNNANTGLRKGNIHGLKGITLKFGKYWVAKHSVSNKSHNIGSFKTKEDAARAYDEYILKIHGEFAKTNKSLGLL